MKKVEYVNKDRVCKSTRMTAVPKLTGSELRLYLYMTDMMNETQYNWFPLDRFDVVVSYGISIASYQRALEGLIQKGYLKKKTPSTYCFDATGSFKVRGSKFDTRS